MTTTINADNTTGGLIASGDGSGILGLQAGGNTVLTLNSSRAVGVGASPSYGTSGQVLTSAGSAAAPTWSAIPATDLATGVTGTLSVANGGTGAASLTANRVLLGNGTSALQEVAPGTSGNVLTSNGTTWTSAAAAGGSLILLSTTAASGTSVDITTGFSTTYSNYVIIATNIKLTAASNSVLATLNYAGTYLSTGYYYTHITGATVQSASNDTLIRINGNGSTFNEGSFVMNINGVNTSGYRTTYSWTGGSANNYWCSGGGTNLGSTGQLQGVRFTCTGTTYSAGTFYLYGIKKT